MRLCLERPRRPTPVVPAERLGEAPPAVVGDQAVNVGKAVARHRRHHRTKGLEERLDVPRAEAVEAALLEDEGVARAALKRVDLVAHAELALSTDAAAPLGDGEGAYLYVHEAFY